MANEQSAAPKPRHRATYATDKKTGGYLIRVQGEYPERFAGREVPVHRKDNTTSTEKLTRLVWTGNDNETGEKVALYKFEAKPRDEQAEMPF